jgi:predicted component of type VI protein secretion system
MGFWDLFRKKKQEPEPEKVKFSELGSWLKKERSSVQDKEKQFLEQVKANLSQLLNELEREKQVLENFDLDSKKAEERYKFIVQENLSYYLGHLSKLMSKLNEIKEDVNVEKINSAP